MNEADLCSKIIGHDLLTAQGWTGLGALDAIYERKKGRGRDGVTVFSSAERQKPLKQLAACILSSLGGAIHWSSHPCHLCTGHPLLLGFSAMTAWEWAVTVDMACSIQWSPQGLWRRVGKGQPFGSGDCPLKTGLHRGLWGGRTSS